MHEVVRSAHSSWGTVGTALVLGLFSFACGDVRVPDSGGDVGDNQDPQVVSFAVASGAPGDSLSGSCVADDPDGDTLAVTVEASSGAIVRDADDFVWIPEIEDVATITCTVDDGRGGEVADTVTATALVSAGLVAHYEFSGDVRDSSGNGHHGTLTRGAFVPGRDGSADAALEFNGDTVVELPNESAFDLVSFSFVARIQVVPSDTPRTILAKLASTSLSDYTWRINSDSSISGPGRLLIDYNNNAGDGTVFSVTRVPSERFVLVAATLDQSALRVFIDGEVDGALALDQFLPSLADGPVTIGKGIGPSFFVGVMDDLRIYDRVLTDYEILALERGRL